ncbi:MAG: hypothetical protein SFY32_05910 [Bacteroidota bacterium]|nr:hypothetical protein [Bacteroidota bacterium]
MIARNKVNKICLFIFFLMFFLSASQVDKNNTKRRNLNYQRIEIKSIHKNEFRITFFFGSAFKDSSKAYFKECIKRDNGFKALRDSINFLTKLVSKSLKPTDSFISKMYLYDSDDWSSDRIVFNLKIEYLIKSDPDKYFDIIDESAFTTLNKKPIFLINENDSLINNKTYEFFIHKNRFCFNYPDTTYSKNIDGIDYYKVLGKQQKFYSLKEISFESGLKLLINGVVFDTTIVYNDLLKLFPLSFLNSNIKNRITLDVKSKNISFLSFDFHFKENKLKKIINNDSKSSDCICKHPETLEYWLDSVFFNR